MQAPFEVWFRLSPLGTGGGVSCNRQGAFVGPVPLLKRTDACGAWQPRPTQELNVELTACFGLPIDVTSKTAGLAAIARALSNNNVVQAQIATLHLQFPDPPEVAKAAPSFIETVALAKLLRRSGLLKAGWDPAKHPRWPAGDTDGRGGEFAPAGSSGADSLTTPLTDRQRADNQTVPRSVPAQLTIPAPFELPFPGEIPFPPQFEFVPPPLDLPNTQPRDGIPPNPFPSRPECIEEWAAARKYCGDLIKKKLLGRGDYREMGKWMWDCMMGQVSEDCGGNSTGA